MRNAKYEIYTEKDYYESNKKVEDKLIYMTNDKREMEEEFNYLCNEFKKKIKEETKIARFNVHVIEIGRPFSYTIRNQNYYSDSYWDKNSRHCNRLGEVVICHGFCDNCIPRKDSISYDKYK